MPAPAFAVPEAILERERWETCPALDELLTSPWRHALGVWRHAGAWTSHERGWRWTLDQLGVDRPLVVTNDKLELRTAPTASTLRDVELAHLLAAAELARMDNSDLGQMLNRRGESGTVIGWVSASRGAVGPADVARAEKAGTELVLEKALAKLGLRLVKVEVRP